MSDVRIIPLHGSSATRWVPRSCVCGQQSLVQGPLSEAQPALLRDRAHSFFPISQYCM